MLKFAIPDAASQDTLTPLWPARKSDGRSTDPHAIPMGAWIRLKPSVATAGFPPSVRTVAEGLKVHGALLGDSGGVDDKILLSLERASWVDAAGNDVAAELASIDGYLHASDFEVIDPTPMMTSEDSMRIE